MRPEYKKFLNKAKQLGIDTVEALYELACEMDNLELTGGEFESARKELKIKMF